MNILIEPSDYPELKNIGDIAMQETAVRRVASLFPHAVLRVLTDSPDALPEYSPNVLGLASTGRKVWMEGIVPDRWLMRHLNRFYRRWRVDHPNLSIKMHLLLLQLRSSPREAALRDFLRQVNQTDLLVVCGMGGITDAFEQYALDLLDTIDLVKRNGRSFVAMFGQGIGPLETGSPVFSRARQVLPQVDLIALREARTGVPLLKEFGVEPSRILVTGDDALKIAGCYRVGELGAGIGVNVRIASYSGLTRADLSELRDPILQFSALKRARLLSLQTSMHQEELDIESIHGLIGNYRLFEREEITGPKDLIECVGKCRIVIVASYHAGVFALAQGVPVVALYKSDYYRDKFLGLEALFGVGVFPVDLSGKSWRSQLLEQAALAWESAPFTRNALLERVKDQIRLGEEAYLRLIRFFESQNRGDHANRDMSGFMGRST